jgi:signal transduction histidine kinase
VLFSLLSNAIKYTGRGGRVDISARLVPDDGELEISVADNGPGIAEADVARVLLPFERAVEQRDSHRPGIGLGLTLVSHLVAQHGGRLTLESKPGQGTIARVFLPATRVLTTG